MSGLVAVPAVAVRFFSKVRVEASGCWGWLACANSSGYGNFKNQGRTVSAHRWAYEWGVGPIPDGLTIDHLCRNRLCVNPEHLEVVTLSENVKRSVQFRLKGTHCKQGHPYDENNSSVYQRFFPGRGRSYVVRACRQCKSRRKQVEVCQ